MKKCIYSAGYAFAPKPVLLGASLLALSVFFSGSGLAQDNLDLGVPPDAPVTSSAETSAAGQPAANDIPVRVPSAQVPQLVEPIATPVNEPRGSDLAPPVSQTPVVASEPAAPTPAPVPVPAPGQNELLPASPDKAVAGAAVAAPVAKAAVDPDLFYDANEIVPKGELAKSAPRKMDPAMEPASRLIVVTKDSGPGSRSAQIISASRAMKLGRYEAALDIYRSLYEKSRKDPQVLMGIAVALQRMGDFDASIAAYQELLDVQPKNTDAEVNMLGLMSEKYPSVALRRLEELRQKDPSNIAVVAQLAVTQAQLNNIDEAIKYLSVAASMQPDNPNHVYNMAVIADRAGNRKEAVKYYEQALDMDSIYGGGRTLPRDVIFERLARLR